MRKVGIRELKAEAVGEKVAPLRGLEPPTHGLGNHDSRSNDIFSMHRYARPACDYVLVRYRAILRVVTIL